MFSQYTNAKTKLYKKQMLITKAEKQLYQCVNNDFKKIVCVCVYTKVETYQIYYKLYYHIYL